MEVYAQNGRQNGISDRRGADAILWIEKTKALRLQGLETVTVRSRVQTILFVLIIPTPRACVKRDLPAYLLHRERPPAQLHAALRGRFVIGDLIGDEYGRKKGSPYPS